MNKRAAALALFIALTTWAATSSAQASTWYISPTGSDSTGAGTTGNPYKTMDKVGTVMAAGDTVIYKDGTYNYAGCEINANVVSGTVGNFTTVKAENDGGAVITQTNGLALPHTSLKSYLDVEGLKFDGAYQKDIQGYHLKFLRCAFKGGDSTGNVTNTAIGSNDYTPVSSYILMEDCWFYGHGGRYNLVVFNAEKVILRRCVGRHETGWDDGVTQNPEAVFTVYNSSDVRLQDVFAIDSTTGPYHTFDSYSAIYLLHNPSASPDHVVKNVYARGSAVIESYGRGYLFEAQNGTADDIQGYDLLCVNTKGSCFELTYNNNMSTAARVGMIRTSSPQVAQDASRFGIGAFGTGSNPFIRDAIARNLTGDDFNGVTPAYFDTFGNGTNLGSGTGRQTYDPLTNGWLYPVRIEAGSALATAGSTGGVLGPTITTKWGTSGAMWGDTGYDTDSGAALWPWPNESRIKTDMCTGYTHGLCASTPTFTTYIWQKFGNTIPASIYGVDTSSPGAPTNLSTTAVTTSSFNYSVTASTDADGSGDINAYYVDVSTDNFSTFSAGYHDFNLGNNITGSITGLTASTTYSWRMYAKDAAGNQGPYSATQTATTSTPAAPSPAGSFSIGSGGSINIGAGGVMTTR